MSSAEQLREEAEKLESSKGGFFAKVGLLAVELYIQLLR